MPIHPFNLSNEGDKTYAEWQFEKGAQTIAYYMPVATPADMFEGKDVLDIGCGAAGKSLYYASLGARRVVGLDVVEHYRDEAMGLARKKGFDGTFEFVCADAAETGFGDGAFDTVIMNDAVEHVARPEAVLREALRLLAPGGRLYLNFPPYYHPYGAHLSDAIAMPWVHVFFSEKTLIAVYKRLVGGLPDAGRRVALRVSRRGGGVGDDIGGAGAGDGGGAGGGADGDSGIGGTGAGDEYLSFINRMTIRRFRGILRELPAECVYYHEEPLRGFLRPLSRLPGFREFFVKMVVAVLAPKP
ncbi:MAG: class I SAM-dependent methyltransferase [Oscillospiraceae bacterium]|nr:class I SAM-dependent methyltransferase [Oscillospiraceae bacterium]